MDDIKENIDECNQNKKCKILIVLDDMIADMLRNKKVNIYQKKENTHFSCFFCNLIFQCQKMIEN